MDLAWHRRLELQVDGYRKDHGKTDIDGVLGRALPMSHLAGEGRSWMRDLPKS